MHGCEIILLVFDEIMFYVFNDMDENSSLNELICIYVLYVECVCVCTHIYKITYIIMLSNYKLIDSSDNCF